MSHRRSRRERTHIRGQRRIGEGLSLLVRTARSRTTTAAVEQGSRSDGGSTNGCDRQSKVDRLSAQIGVARKASAYTCTPPASSKLREPRPPSPRGRTRERSPARTKVLLRKLTPPGATPSAAVPGGNRIAAKPTATKRWQPRPDRAHSRSRGAKDGAVFSRVCGRGPATVDGDAAAVLPPSAIQGSVLL